MKTICKRCQMWEEDGANLQETIMAYVESLDKEIKVNAQQYEERLEACDTCEALVNGLCKFCGCFVMARAAKKNQRCPDPKHSKW